VNLVACVFNLLKELEVGVDRSDIELTTQCLETLTEFVQGQQSIENSKMLLRLKCHSVVDRLLTRDPHQLSGSTVRQVAALRRNAAILLLALLLRKELKLAGLRVTLDTMIEADYKHRYKDKHQRTRGEGPYRAAILPLYVLMNRLAERTDEESYWHHVAEKELHPTKLSFPKTAAGSVVPCRMWR